VPTAQLAQWANPENPRRMSDHDFGVLEASMQTFGCVQDVLVNRRSRRRGWRKGSTPSVVGGHQRVRAALLTSVALAELPTTWVDLDASGEIQLGLVLNRNSGDWEPDDLERFLRRLEEAGGDLKLTGFTEPELDAWLGRTEQDPPEEFTEPGEATSHECPKCGYVWNE
jgi:ParB-like chromosome segregation protein Spo0J